MILRGTLGHSSSVMRLAILALVLLVVVFGVLSRPRIAQDPAYHRMADVRTLLGIPNALNVLSNLPFAVVGVLGLMQVLSRRTVQEDDRGAYVAFFGGTLLTAFGSSYYHLAPDNGRLVWDRLPMTVAFMGLLAAIVAERLSASLGRALLLPLLLAGAGSVAYWYRTEMGGAGDLRPYALVQFGSLLAIVFIVVLFPDVRGRLGTRFLVAGLVAYAAAKILELADGPIFDRLGWVSGHSLKHVLAALAAGGMVAMLAQREEPPPKSAPPTQG
jgi:hypothetical protein